MCRGKLIEENKAMKIEGKRCDGDKERKIKSSEEEKWKEKWRRKENNFCIGKKMER